VSQDFSLTELHGGHDLPVLSACQPLRSASHLEYFWQARFFFRGTATGVDRPGEVSIQSALAPRPSLSKR
jgi:hypothetical protein